jgi:hypothetical protein
LAGLPIVDPPLRRWRGLRYKDKTATVIYDDGKADVSQLTSATTKAGYPSAPKS